MVLPVTPNPSSLSRPPQFKAPVSPPVLKNSSSKGLLPTKSDVAPSLMPDIRPKLPSMSPAKPLSKDAVNPVAPVQKSEKTLDKLEIRTMKDDIDELRATATPPSKPSVASTPPVLSNKAPLYQPSTSIPKPSGPNPGRTVTPPAKVIKSQRRRKKSHKAVKSVALALLLLGVIVGGGGATWWYFGDVILPASKNNGLIAASTEVIPANYSIIIHYKLASLSDRTLVSTAWQKQRGIEDQEIQAALNGDPRIFIDDPSLTDIFYVLLPDSPRPYVLVPQTDGTEDLLNKFSAQIQITKYQGWYVVHPVATEKYIEAVSSNRLAQLQEEYSAIVSTQANAPIRIMLNAGTIESLHQAVLGNGLGSSQLSQIQLLGHPTSGEAALEFSGEADLLASVISNNITLRNSQELVSQIPSEADFVRLGGNLASDLTEWGKIATDIDRNSLNLASVRQLISSFESPYAFFISHKAAGERDFGLVVPLSEQQRQSVIQATATLEEGLLTLAPLLTGKQVIAPVAFTSSVYQGTNLRYANFSSSSSALDYAVTDKFLLIATSKSTMFNLIDIANANPGASSVASAANFQSLLGYWGSLPEADNLVLSSASYEPLSQLLPVGQAAGQLVLGLAIKFNSVSQDQRDISGILLLDNNQPTDTTKE